MPSADDLPLSLDSIGLISSSFPSTSSLEGGGKATKKVCPVSKFGTKRSDATYLTLSSPHLL